VVYDCGSEPGMYVVRDPPRLDWTPIVTLEHYSVDAGAIVAAEEKTA